MPIDDAKFTMRPHPCRRMCGYTACIAHSVPFTPECRRRRRRASSTSAIGASGRNVCALLIDPSTRPNRSTVCATIASICVALLDVAHDAEVLDAERRRARRHVSAIRSSFHSATTTRAPPLPRCRAIPLPTPLPDPVTMITLPSTECIVARDPTCGAQYDGLTLARPRCPSGPYRVGGIMELQGRSWSPAAAAASAARPAARAPAKGAAVAVVDLHAEQRGRDRRARSRRRRPARPTPAMSATTRRSPPPSAAAARPRPHHGRRDRGRHLPRPRPPARARGVGRRLRPRARA